MLYIVTGGAMSRKDEILREKIREAVAKGKEIYVFVPDQFSFEYDKMLYNIFGAKMFNKISVVGMNRFAEELRKKYGSKNGEAADENTRIILMYKALRRFREEKKAVYFSRNLEKPSFVPEMLEMVSELKRNGITPEALEVSTLKFSGTLGDKLRDVSGIFKCYNDELSKRGLCDGISSVSEACEILKENDVFKNCEIFFDRYDTFSADEYRMIEIMLHKCDDMYVAITLSDENNSRLKLSPFAVTLKTKSSLESLAKTAGIKTERIKTDRYYYNKSSLVHINANIFCINNHPCADTEGVRVVNAQDCYDEVEYCAAEIKRLVREEKLSYKDIAVISRQLSSYAPIIEGTFEKYEIPAFIDIKETVSKSTVSIYLSAVFDCLKGKSFKTEKILRMIKSPLSPFKDFEISAIEEYCYTWGVEDDMWKEPFTATDPKMDNLETVNAIRKAIVEPVIDFREKTKNVTVKEMTSQFTQLLEKYKLTSCANSIAKMSGSFDKDKSAVTDKSQELELVREFKQVWMLFIEGLRSVCDNLSDEVISLKEFSELFLLILSGMKVSNPPQRINTVTVASAEHSRLSAVKAVFVLGVNADKLPFVSQSGGMFSEREKKQLCENGIELSKTAVNNIQNERLIAYLALTQGSDKLYVCCPKADRKGSSLVPSGIVKELLRMFGNEIAVDASKLKIDFFCPTARAAYSKLSECLNDNTVSSNTLKAALEKLPDYSERVRTLEANSRAAAFSLSKETAQKLFFKNEGGKNTVSLSPSSVEKYYKCPFNYFCQYGLNLRVPVKNEINGVNRGNVVHYVLENIMSVEENGTRVYDSSFEKLSENEIRSRVYKLSEEYKNKEMGGDFGKNERFRSVFKRIQDNTVLVVKNIQEELCGSSFKPEAFEYVIDNKNGKPLLVIENENIKIKVKGKIDRIDTYKDEQSNSYIKIVDYKTGVDKDLLRKIFHGVSLQLVIYLMALLNSENPLNDGSAQPGGIVYTPAVYINSSGSREEEKKIPENIGEEEKIEIMSGFAWDYVKKKLERFGIVNSDEAVLSALNNFGDEKFVPLAKKNPFDKKRLMAVGSFTLDMLEKAGLSISEGRIPAEPLADATSANIRKPCSYCSYSAVCGAKNSKPKRLILKDDSNKLMDVIDSYVLENKGGEE